MIGPASLRRNDLTLLRMSTVNHRLAQLQEGEDMEYIIFGDNVYKRRSPITSYVSAANDNPLAVHFVLWNRGMKNVRISIE